MGRDPFENPDETRGPVAARCHERVLIGLCVAWYSQFFLAAFD